MSTSGGNDRVSNKQLYDELGALRREIPSRREIYAVISAALVLGQIGARVEIKGVPSPAPLALDLLRFINLI